MNSADCCNGWIGYLPFLKYIVHDSNGVLSGNEIYVYYLIYLFNTVISYFVTYKFSLVNAEQKSYIFTTINAITNFLTVSFSNYCIIGVLKIFFLLSSDSISYRCICRK